MTGAMTLLLLRRGQRPADAQPGRQSLGLLTPQGDFTGAVSDGRGAQNHPSRSGRLLLRGRRTARLRCAANPSPSAGDRRAAAWSPPAPTRRGGWRPFGRWRWGRRCVPLPGAAHRAGAPSRLCGALAAGDGDPAPADAARRADFDRRGVSGCDRPRRRCRRAGRGVAERDPPRGGVGLPASLGVATNKLVAKIANNVGKAAASGDAPPSARQIVPPGEEAAFLAPLPADALWGVGPKTAARLHALGSTPRESGGRWFGKGRKGDRQPCRARSKCDQQETTLCAIGADAAPSRRCATGDRKGDMEGR